jgi:hypothetical protein
MSMRHAALALLVLTLPRAVASADSFGGFSGVDRQYVVNQEKVCKPLDVKAGAATGTPACETATADIIARLSFKDPIIQSGRDATFAATASGATLTVTKKAAGTTLVTWKAPDKIKVVDVFKDQYDTRIAVTYTTRRAGKEVTDVIAFDLGQGAATTKPVDPVTNPTTNPAPVAPIDPKLAKALEVARKAPKGKAVAAWKAVLAIDATNSEAQFRIAQVQAAGKQHAEAIATLTALAGSPAPDAIEWLIEARFDNAFAALRADPKFRAAVGLDRKGTSLYEKLMGFGGQWEQTGTPCDKPEIRFTTLRDHTFKLRVKTTCSGQVYDTPFKGTWRIDGTHLVLGLPNKGKVTADDEAGCEFETQGDEDALRCQIGRDIEFTVLPTRR